jgi:ABC-type polysaccharide/polyol phosphate export permease
MLGGRYQFVLQMNPLYYAIEIIRAPIIASIPGLTTYVASGLIGIVCTLLGAFAVARSRKSLAYWV